MWNTGEVRINRFNVEEEKWAEYDLFASLIKPEIFTQVKVIDSAFSWEKITVEVQGKSYHLDFEPGRCYKESILVSAFEPEKEMAHLLKDIRLKAGLSQAELGIRTGYSPKYISKIERGITSIQLDTIEYILKVGLSYKLTATRADFSQAA